MRKSIIAALIVTLISMPFVFASADDAGLKKSGLELRITPYVFGMYDFYNGHNIANARDFTTTECGLSLGVGYKVMATKWLSVDIDSDYTLMVKDKSLIPDGKIVHYADAMAGLTFHTPSESVDAYIGLLCGALYQHNVDLNTFSFAAGVKAGAVFPVSEHMAMGIEARALGSYLPDSDSLYNSITALIDSCTAVIEWRF